MGVRCQSTWFSVKRLGILTYLSIFLMSGCNLPWTNARKISNEHNVRGWSSVGHVHFSESYLAFRKKIIMQCARSPKTPPQLDKFSKSFCRTTAHCAFSRLGLVSFRKAPPGRLLLLRSKLRRTVFYLPWACSLWFGALYTYMANLISVFDGFVYMLSMLSS